MMMYQNGLVVNLGDVIIPQQWTAGTSTGTPGDGTAISAYHVTTAGTLGAEPGSNWPGAAEDQFPVCGTAHFRSKNLYHYDPSASSNGTGSQSSPVNTAGSASATNGRVVLMRKGTNASSVNTSFSASGSLANNTYAWISSYNTGPDSGMPILGALAISNCAGVIVESIMCVGTGSTNGHAYTSGSGTACSEFYYRNCWAVGVSGGGGNNDGFVANSTASTDLSIVSLWYENCYAINNAGYGFGLEAANTAQNAARPIQYYNCVAVGNGTGKQAWNFGGYARFTAQSTGWTRVGGAGTFIYSRSEATTTCRVADHGGSNFSQLVGAGATSSPGVGQWGQTGGVLYINVGVDTGTSLTGHTIYWSYNYLDNVYFLNCTSSKAIALNGTSDGSGFGSDTLTSGWTYQGCLSYNNQGEGFISNISLAPTLVSCISLNNGTVVTTAAGIVFNNTDTATVQNSISNGTKNNSGLSGANPNGTMIIRNSIFQGNAAYGINKSGTLTENHNDFFSNASGTINGQAIDGTSLTVDPQLDGVYRASNTALHAVGLFLGGSDFYNSGFPFPQDIGPVQYSGSRSVSVSRSVDITRSLGTRSITTIRGVSV